MIPRRKEVGPEVKGPEVKAAGVILYKIVEGCPYYLFQVVSRMKRGQHRLSWEDFGGKREQEDVDISDTIAREAWEESNGYFDRDDLKKRLDGCIKRIYDERCKYMVYFLPATETETEWSGAEMGAKESAQGYERSVKWIRHNDVAFRWRRMLHIRLQSVSVFRKSVQHARQWLK